MKAKKLKKLYQFKYLVETYEYHMAKGKKKVIFHVYMLNVHDKEAVRIC